MPWPISRTRKWRKFYKEMYGRLKPEGWTPKPTVEPAYRRPSISERFAMWNLAASGMSARAIGVQLFRDHHTVLRHLDPERGKQLALDLALHGKRGAAREMVQRLGNDAEFAARVEQCIATFERWANFERTRIATIADACLSRSFRARGFTTYRAG
jgi:hypothetical protein